MWDWGSGLSSGRAVGRSVGRWSVVEFLFPPSLSNPGGPVRLCDGPGPPARRRHGFTRKSTRRKLIRDKYVRNVNRRPLEIPHASPLARQSPWLDRIHPADRNNPPHGCRACHLEDRIPQAVECGGSQSARADGGRHRRHRRRAALPADDHGDRHRAGPAIDHPEQRDRRHGSPGGARVRPHGGGRRVAGGARRLGRGGGARGRDGPGRAGADYAEAARVAEPAPGGVPGGSGPGAGGARRGGGAGGADAGHHRAEDHPRAVPRPRRSGRRPPGPVPRRGHRAHHPAGRGHRGARRLRRGAAGRGGTPGG